MAQGSVGLDVLWGDVAMQRLCDRVPEAAGRTVVRPYPQSESVNWGRIAAPLVSRLP